MDQERKKYRLRLASAFISEGKNLHAIQVYRNLMKECPDDDLYFLLAELFEDMRMIDAGENVLLELLENKEDKTEVSMYLGQYLLRNSKWIDAIQILSTITDQIHSSNFLIGYSYVMINQFELAKEYFTTYIASDDNTELKQEANIYLAKIEYELSNFDSALNYAQNAQFLYSDFWELNLILAKVYYSLGMFAHALSPVDKAYKLNPKETTVLEFAGKIYYQVEKYESSIKFFSEYIEQSSNISAEIYTLLAKSYVKQKKNNDAELFFTLALQVDPEYQPALSGKLNLNV